MDKKFIALHRAHIEGYFDRLNEALDLRNSIAEKVEYTIFQIQIEKQREARYNSELQPDKYTDHKLYIDEIGDIVHSLELYLIELKQYASKSIKAYRWLVDENKKRLLYDKLSDAGFIDEKTAFEAFVSLFSGTADTSHGKIIWLKSGRNKEVNKKSIIDFLDILKEKSIISEGNVKTKADTNTLLTALFSTQTKFTNANHPTDGNYSEFYKELEDIVASI